MNHLQAELKQAGAKPSEIKQLLPIATGLRQIGQKSRHSGWLKLVWPVSYGLVGTMVGVVLIISAEAASPTSWLYGLQKLADASVVKLDPSYRATVMMKQAHQVNWLVAQKASPHQILAVLADYADTARTYQGQSGTNYAAFDYCKTNLQQAAVQASPAVRQAINNSLASLNDV
jgi:hypothetical protein